MLGKHGEGLYMGEGGRGGGRYSLFRGVYQLQNYSPEGLNPQRDSTEIVIKIKQLYHG